MSVEYGIACHPLVFIAGVIAWHRVMVVAIDIIAGQLVLSTSKKKKSETNHLQQQP